MLRLLKYLVLAAIAVVLVVLALANQQTVVLKLLPDDIAAWAGVDVQTIEPPLFVVIFGGVAIGLVIGRIAEWLREYRFRADAKLQRRERTKLEREVASLKGSSSTEKDDVLALLEDGGRTG